MQGALSIFMRSCVAFALLAACSAYAVSAQDTDRQVVSAVLSHFVARTDEWFYAAAAKLAISSTTRKKFWVASDYQYLNQPGHKCEIDKPLYLEFLARNVKEEPVAAMVADSASWFIVPREQEKFLGVGMPTPENMTKRIAVKTLVKLSRPAYSKDGDRAFIMFSYPWSIHSAYAQYVLRRQTGKWNVECAEFPHSV